jgi:hypothetical protein
VVTPGRTAPPSPRAAATPDSIYGLWGGSVTSATEQIDIRMRVAPSETTMAARCTFPDGAMVTVGASAASRLDKTTALACFPPGGGGGEAICGDMTLLESKTAKVAHGTLYCAIQIQPASYEYSLAGTRMRLTLGADALELVKVGD